MRAGMDIDCGSAMEPASMDEALSQGLINEAQIDLALHRLFRVQFRLGMFDPADKQPLRSIPTSAIGTSAHAALALQAARQSLVLLKNDAGALPLHGRTLNVAVLGPHGNASNAMQSNYFGIAPFLVTPLDGVRVFAPDAAYAPGCLDVLCANTSGFDAATAAASKADVVLLFVGLSLDVEREGMDRVNITLPGLQPALIDAVLAAAPPTANIIMVVLCGGSVDISTQVADPRVSAILWAGYPGQAGGTAIAEALWGMHPPSGRLTQTWYPADFIDQVSMFDMGMRPNASNGNPGRGHRFYTGTPVFPFGYGLSYTTFSLSWAAGGAPDTVVPMRSLTRELPALRIDAAARAPEAQGGAVVAKPLPVLATATLLVTNTGAHASPRVVLAFVSPPPHAVATMGAPQQVLVWYGRTPTLLPGRSATLSFDITARQLTFTSPEGTPAAMAGNWTLNVDGLAATFTVVGAGGGASSDSTAMEAAGRHGGAGTYWAVSGVAHESGVAART